MDILFEILIDANLSVTVFFWLSVVLGIPLGLQFRKVTLRMDAKRNPVINSLKVTHTIRIKTNGQSKIVLLMSIFLSPLIAIVWWRLPLVSPIVGVAYGVICKMLSRVPIESNIPNSFFR